VTDEQAAVAGATETRRLEQRLMRERAARREAETIAEAVTRRLFDQQRRLELMQAVATAANYMDDPADAYRFSIERICEHTGCSVGHVWVMADDQPESGLVSAGIWYPASSSAMSFHSGSTMLHLIPEMSLPHRVLVQGRAIWSEDLTREADCPRARAALSSGLRAGFAFPVLVGDEVAAVLEFFQSRMAPADEALLETLDRMASILGRVVERHRGIVRLQQNYELAAQRDAAEQASQAKSAFLAVTSHEVRTPLNAVLGLAEALGRESLTSSQKELNNGILEAGGMLLRLLNAVLDMSKIEAGEAVPLLDDFDLATTLRSIVSIWKPRALDLGIELRLEVAGIGPGRVRSDQGRIEQCLINLISNAIKFTPPNAEVILRASSTEAGARFEVIDGGVGVPEIDRDRIFRPFEQTQAGRKAGGAGLGLSICVGNTRMLGGDIGTDRDELGRSRFWFTCDLLPCEEGGGAATEEVAVSEVPRGLRVLAAEDNLANRRVLQVLLAPAEVVLTLVEDGAQAVEALRGARFDLILMDVNMPVMGGVEAVGLIRADGLANGAPIYMLTANAFVDDVERYLAAGADGVVTKPINVAELFRILAPAPSAPATKAS
jgi:signal transduction histidine kinase